MSTFIQKHTFHHPDELHGIKDLAGRRMMYVATPVLDVNGELLGSILVPTTEFSLRVLLSAATRSALSLVLNANEHDDRIEFELAPAT